MRPAFFPRTRMTSSYSTTKSHCRLQGSSRFHSRQVWIEHSMRVCVCVFFLCVCIASSRVTNEKEKVLPMYSDWSANKGQVRSFSTSLLGLNC